MQQHDIVKIHSNMTEEASLGQGSGSGRNNFRSRRLPLVLISILAPACPNFASQGRGCDAVGTDPRGRRGAASGVRIRSYPRLFTHPIERRGCTSRLIRGARGDGNKFDPGQIHSKAQ
jgi:hypothetical protein